MMKRLFSLIAIGLSLMTINAQDVGFENYREKLLDEFNAYNDRLLSEYESYRQRINADYTEHMRQMWKDYYAFKGVPMPKEYVKPVPPVIFIDQEPTPNINQEIPVEPVSPVLPETAPQPQPVAPIENTPIIDPIYFTTIYCGTEIHVRLSEKERFNLKSLENNHIADAWNELCTDPYIVLLYDCLQMREELQLCDWAYLCMLSNICNEFFGEDTNEATLLLAWLYCQSGYKMRLGTYKRHLEMLFASKFKIYNWSYYIVGGEYFYPIHRGEEDLKIFDYAFKSEESMSLIMGRQQKLAVAVSSPRTIVATHYPQLSVKISVNKNLLEFYDSYPTSEIGDNLMTRWAMYAQVPLSETAQRQLYPKLIQGISGCNQFEAANRLLNWVQTGFEYEYDDKVWGEDRAFFSEESLFYPYCDCEDRSILFSRLIRDLLGLEVLLVYYPGHLATAIGFPNQVQGDYIILNNKKYIIADPTYIGAPIGTSMPNMSTKESTAILLQ